MNKQNELLGAYDITNKCSIEVNLKSNHDQRRIFRCHFESSAIK